MPKNKTHVEKMNLITYIVPKFNGFVSKNLGYRKYILSYHVMYPVSQPIFPYLSTEENPWKKAPSITSNIFPHIGLWIFALFHLRKLLKRCSRNVSLIYVGKLLTFLKGTSSTRLYPFKTIQPFYTVREKTHASTMLQLSLQTSQKKRN